MNSRWKAQLNLVIKIELKILYFDDNYQNSSLARILIFILHNSLDLVTFRNKIENSIKFRFWWVKFNFEPLFQPDTTKNYENNLLIYNKT